MKMIREEIEAALKYAELQLALSTNDTKTRCFRTIVLLLRAELDREKNALTCEGCKREEAKKDYMHVICMQCTRMNQTRDRYEPKGEPNV